MPVAVGLLLLALLAGAIAGGRYAWKAYEAHRGQKKSSAMVSLPAAAQAQMLTTNSATGRLDLSMVASASTHVQVVADGKLFLTPTWPPAKAAGLRRRIGWK
jgi:hypothetical protein